MKDIVDDHTCDQQDFVERVNPTCTETGVESGVQCSICGQNKDGFETIPA